MKIHKKTLKICRNTKKKTVGIITDGQIRRYNEKNFNLHDKKAFKMHLYKK